MSMELPNFDAMEQADLHAFGFKPRGIRPIAEAREMFPARPKGYVRAFCNLTHYACNKAVAMDLRLNGKIQRALEYEEIADGIYERLPDYAKW